MERVCYAVADAAPHAAVVARAHTHSVVKAGVHVERLSEMGHCSGPRDLDDGPEGWSFGVILCQHECLEFPEVTVISGRVLGCWNEKGQPCDQQREKNWG